MGTDISAVFGHQLPFPPTESVVEGMCKGIHLLNPEFEGEWDLVPDHDPGCGLVYVRGPLRLYFGPHAVFIGTGCRWPRPNEHEEEKSGLISAVSAIADYFRSPSVIFLPGDIKPWNSAYEWVGEGLTFDQIKRRFAEIKKPSPAFQATLKLHADYYEINGYVIKELAPKAV